MEVLISSKFTKRPLARIATIMLLAFTLYVISGVFSKMASQHPFLSLPYVGCFCCVVISLGLYAIFWQKILSLLPLSKAFLSKSITTVMILVISAFLFGESVSIKNIVGASFIIFGLIVLVWRK